MLLPIYTPSGRALPTVEEFAVQIDGTSVSSYTFPGVTLTQAGLLVVRFLVTGVFNATRTASAVTIGGNAATIIQQNNQHVTGLLNSVAVGLAVRSMSAGATGNIVVTISGGLNAAAVAIHPICIRGLASTTAFHNNGASANGATSVGTTLNIPASGIQVVAAGSGQGAQSHTPTGFTDQIASGTQVDTTWRLHDGYDIGLSAQTGRSLASASASTSYRAIAAASWA